MIYFEKRQIDKDDDAVDNDAKYTLIFMCKSRL